MYVLWVEIEHMVLFFSVIEIKSKVLHKVIKCSVEENLITVLKPVILHFFSGTDHKHKGIARKNAMISM